MREFRDCCFVAGDARLYGPLSAISLSKSKLKVEEPDLLLESAGGDVAGVDCGRLSPSNGLLFGLSRSLAGAVLLDVEVEPWL